MSDKEIIDVCDMKEKLNEIFNKENTKGVLQGDRKIRKGLTGKRVIFFPSSKNNALMPCESRLEAENCLAMEFDQSVQNYRSQPFTIRLSGKETYTPDSVQKCRQGNFSFREVKFSGSLESQKLIERLAKIKLILSSANYRFEVLTEQDLHNYPENENRKYLYRNTHLTFHYFQIQAAINLIPDDAEMYSLDRFRSDCSKLGLNPLSADWMILKGKVKYEKQKLLTGDSNIWKSGGKV